MMENCDQICPVVVISHRKVQAGKMEDYKKAYMAAWEHYKCAVPRMKSLMCSEDPEKPDYVWDVQWFADMDAFMMHADMTNETTMQRMMGFLSFNDMSYPFEGVVMGGWDDRAVKMTKSNGANFCFVKSHCGFIRGAPLDRCGPPTIVFSKRQVKPGCMIPLMGAYECLAKHYKCNDKGVVAFTVAKDPNNPNQIFDLQVFADDAGFLSHANTSIPAVKNGFDGLFANYNMQGEIPALTGQAWANDAAGVKEKTSSMGAQFSVHPMNGICGGIDLSKAEICAEPIVVFSRRVVKKDKCEEYKNAY